MRVIKGGEQLPCAVDMGAMAVMLVVIMVVIYSRLGFVRLLGIGHILWIPMLPWMIWELPNGHINVAIANV